MSEVKAVDSSIKSKYRIMLMVSKEDLDYPQAQVIQHDAAERLVADGFTVRFIKIFSEDF